jgi:hypothetical protein
MKKYIRSIYIIKAYFLNGSINYFTNVISCAKFIHVSNDTITKRLNDGKPSFAHSLLHFVRSAQKYRRYSSCQLY